MVIGWPARVSCWLPSTPPMANDAGSPVDPSIVQWTGCATLPPGSASVRVTPLAAPVPLLLTVTVNPMSVPAETLAASAVLVTLMTAGLAWKHSFSVVVLVVVR